MRTKKFLAIQTMFLIPILVMVCGHGVLGAQAISETDPNEESLRLSRQASKIRSEANRGSPEAIRHAAMKALEIYEKAYEVANKVGKDYLLGELGKTALDANQIEKARQYAQAALKITHRGWAFGNRIHDGNLILGRIALREGNLEDFVGKDYLLGELGKTALDANQIEKARQYAQAALKITHRGWAFGNRIHDGNLILGRIALREGNLEEAKNRLVAAGTTPGAPNLNSFGPNMMLAKELLDQGEQDVVFKYFYLCSRFWDSERAREKMSRWRDQIKAGQIPDFGGHLDY